METDYTKYSYRGLTSNEEGDIIGYALMKQGYAKRNGEEVDSECIAVMLNSEPLKDYATIKKIKEELVIQPVHYSRHGNYLGEEEEYFTPLNLI